MSSQLISMELKNQIVQKLKQQALIPRPYTLADLLKLAIPLLKKMQKNGHSIEEMSEIFRQYQLSIPPLKELLQTQKAKASKKVPRQQAAKLEKQLAQTISETVFIEILAQLKQQSEIRQGLTRQELIRDLVEPITAMLEARYTYEEIAQFLREQGVSIKAGTLKTYYKAAKRQMVRGDEGTRRRVQSEQGTRRQGDGVRGNSGLISPNPPVSQSPSLRIPQSPSLKTEPTRKENRFPESTSTDQLASEFNL